MSFGWGEATRKQAWRLLEAAAYRAATDQETGGLRISWEAGSAQLLGAGPAELGAETVLRDIFGVVYKDWLYHIRRVQDMDMTYSWEHLVLTPGGEKNVRHSLTPLGSDDAGSGFTVLGILQHVPPVELDKDTKMQMEVFEGLPVGVYFIDLDYRMRWVNRLGMTQSHINWKNHYGEVCYELPFGRDSHCDNCPVVRSHNDGVISSNELVMPNGATWLLTAMPIYGRDGEKIGAVEVVTDISEIAKERRTTLETLRAHESQLREQNAALIGLHAQPISGVPDLFAMIRTITETAARVLKATSARVWQFGDDICNCVDVYISATGEHAPGRTVPMSFYERHKELFNSARQIIIRDSWTGEELPKLSSLFRRNRIRSVMYCPIRQHGEILGFISVEDSDLHEWSLEEQVFGASLADYTALIIGHMCLHEGERRISTLISNLPGMAFRLRCLPDCFEYEFASEGALSLTGYPAESFLGAGGSVFSEMVHDEDRMTYLVTHLALDKPEAPLELFFRIVRADGVVRWLWERSRVVARSDDGGITYEGLYFDITVRYQLQEAELAAKAKTDFLTRMSHEIRTPMNAIIGLSDLASREYGKPKALEYIMGIKSAGVSLLAIIDDILDFSKIESGNLSVIPVCYETASLFNDVLTIIRVRIAETPLELILDISPNIPAAMIGDAGRIKQILLNLLSNAVKYTKNGFIKFSVSGEAVAENTMRLVFIVADSGIGIKDEDLPKLFEEFSRIDEKLNSGIEGTGLGLAIANSLCRAMGGTITARSEYGKGSVFTATLEQTVVDWQPMGDLVGMAVACAQTQCITFIAPEAEVLVVDDLSSNLLVAEGLLVPYGMRVFTCLNGQEAVELVRERPFDLVLMDHMMPGMDGVEATGIIRGMDECRTLPVIALTANAVSGMREMFLENGFNDFISKPIDPAKLDAVLKKWIPVDKRRNTPEGGENIPKSAEPSELDLPEIAGVNVAAGLARIGGVQKRYLTLLEIFYQDAQAGLALLEREPDEASLISFITRVHALRSALANIGADGLSRGAALLEKAGREGDMSVIRDNLPRFREEFAALTARLGEVTARARAGDERQADPQVWEALAHLREALKAKNIDAIYAARARLQGMPLTGAISAAVSRIADCILLMEFKKAEDILIAFSERKN